MRLKTPIVKIRDILIGGESPVAIQSMTNTDTADAIATAKQCIELADAGAEIVRITIDNESSAKAVKEIRKILDKKGYKHLPLVGDFHNNGHLLLSKITECAKILDKYRINPGNVGYGEKHDANFSSIIKIAIKNNKPIRIGVNTGSLDQELLSKKKSIIEAAIESALSSAKLAEKIGLKRNKIVLSIKASSVQETLKIYELLVEKMKKNKRIYALHTGLTEAGSDLQGIVSSSVALGILLQKGIGDTIRVSITPTQGQPRTKEVEVCKELLQSMDLRYFKPKIISCPGCGRTNNVFFQKLVKEINSKVQKFKGIEKLKIAIMGCIVNGPGESKYADISLCLPGKNEEKIAQLYVKGKFIKNLKGQNIIKEFQRILKSFGN